MGKKMIDQAGELPPFVEGTYTVFFMKDGKQTNSVELKSEEKVEEMFAEFKKKNPSAYLTMIAKDLYDINY